MSYIVVCPLDRVTETAHRHKAGAMVTLLSQAHDMHRPAIIAREHHLVLTLNDIAANATTPGLIAPAASHVESLIGFVRAWQCQAPLLLHCWMGISRSPAARTHRRSGARPGAGR